MKIEDCQDKEIESVETGWSDCETCGFYDWITVTFTDGTRLYGDGHLSGTFVSDVEEFLDNKGWK